MIGPSPGQEEFERPTSEQKVGTGGHCAQRHGRRQGGSQGGAYTHTARADAGAKRHRGRGLAHCLLLPPAPTAVQVQAVLKIHHRTRPYQPQLAVPACAVPSPKDPAQGRLSSFPRLQLRWQKKGFCTKNAGRWQKLLCECVCHSSQYNGEYCGVSVSRASWRHPEPDSRPGIVPSLFTAHRLVYLCDGGPG